MPGIKLDLTFALPEIVTEDEKERPAATAFLLRPEFSG
jgi:hypothetical protein